MSARERFEDALRNAGKYVDPQRALCPAHDDNNASLSISDRRDGKGFVIKCHAGCEYQDVLAELGWLPRDLFDDDGMREIYAPKRDYRYPDGRVVRRKPDKSFPQSGNTKGNSLFHADRIGDAATVYVVEGEKDVEAIEAVGGVAVCPPMGAGQKNLDRYDWSKLRDKHAIVAADKDNAGYKHAAQVAERLDGVAKSVRIVEAAVGNDVADHVAAGKALDELVEPEPEPEPPVDETVRTVPWPTLNNAALHGIAGKIVNLVAPHTEADPAAILVQLLAEFGATVGASAHFIAGNDRHQAIINPLVVGRTNNGAKGTALAVVDAIRQRALPWFDEFTTSGLSSAEGLIEMVRDPSGEPNDKDYDSGVVDKRLLIKESEYKSVLVRQRRDGNTLGPTLRDAFDCRTLRTLTRKHNRLTATDPHIVVIGHVTPGEFRATLQDSDLSGGTVNRMLICLSRRSRLHSRLGNLPVNVLVDAAGLFEDAYKAAAPRCEMKFTDQFWGLWDTAYRELNRDRPDSRATEATARAVTMVLRLSMLYALLDSKDAIGVEHLDAALALWSYAEHSARWLFSSHELEAERESAGGLANFILEGGEAGRTRTEISRGYFKGNKPAAEINVELAPLVHDGVLIEIKEETGARPILRYVHRSLRNNEITKPAGQGINSGTNLDELGTNLPSDDVAVAEVNSSEFVDSSSYETCPDLRSSSNSLIRSPECNTDTAVSR
jgi:5S rRNA maturation endonuclease (ribonuclease M5)